MKTLAALTTVLALSTLTTTAFAQQEAAPMQIVAPAPAMSVRAEATMPNLDGLRYRGGSIPRGYFLETRLLETHTFVAGITMTSAMYAGSAMWALFTCPPGVQLNSCATNGSTLFLYIPVIGPFITAFSPSASPGGAALSALSGVVQAVGLGLTIHGLVHPARFYQRDPGAAYASNTRSVRWNATPMADRSFAGMALSVQHF